MEDGRCLWPRSKEIGGSSVINHMLYIRGNKKDYNIWEQLGNPGWSYKDVLTYFKKSEDNRNQNYTKTPYHSTRGYLTVDESQWQSPVGACKMGPNSDPTAVVDPRLRVYGVTGLRIIHGSIMPGIVNGNPNAPIIMIAEKGSDMIKEEWLMK